MKRKFGRYFPCASEYADPGNLTKATGLSGIVTAMALPRIAMGGLDVRLYGLTCFVAMTLVAAAVTAWSHSASMGGLYQGRKRTLAGLAVAALIGAVATPILHFGINPAIQMAVGACGNACWAEMQFPTTLAGLLGLIAWSAGFQTLFCTAGPLCLIARLTNRQSASIVLTTLFAVYVVSRQLTEFGVPEGHAAMLLTAAVKSVLCCLVFVRAGLLPCAALSAAFQVHLLWELEH